LTDPYDHQHHNKQTKHHLGRLSYHFGKWVITGVGTLQTGYPRESLSQDKEQSVHPHAVTCPTAPDPASLLRWAPTLPHILQLRTSPPCRRALTLPRVPRPQTSPPCRGSLRRCHVPCSSGPRLHVEEGSGAITCPTAPDPASLLGRAPTLPHVPQFSVGRGPQV
jgi:hypothetical protein